MTSEEFDAMEWQLWPRKHWVFGPKVRGLVRQNVALIYFDPNAGEYGRPWLWHIDGDIVPSLKDNFGYASDWDVAINIVEDTIRKAIREAEAK